MTRVVSREEDVQPPFMRDDPGQDVSSHRAPLSNVKAPDGRGTGVVYTMRADGEKASGESWVLYIVVRTGWRGSASIFLVCSM